METGRKINGIEHTHTEVLPVVLYKDLERGEANVSLASGIRVPLQSRRTHDPFFKSRKFSSCVVVMCVWYVCVFVYVCVCVCVCVHICK